MSVSVPLTVNELAPLVPLSNASPVVDPSVSVPRFAASDTLMSAPPTSGSLTCISFAPLRSKLTSSVGWSVPPGAVIDGPSLPGWTATVEVALAVAPASSVAVTVTVRSVVSGASLLSWNRTASMAASSSAVLAAFRVMAIVFVFVVTPRSAASAPVSITSPSPVSPCGLSRVTVTVEVEPSASLRLVEPVTATLSLVPVPWSSFSLNVTDASVPPASVSRSTVGGVLLWSTTMLSIATWSPSVLVNRTSSTR